MFRRVREYARDILTVHQDTVAALERVRVAVAAAAERQGHPIPQNDLDDLRGRLDELERRRALWEAEVEGTLQKAEAAWRGARSAEERARYMARKRDADDDEGDQEELDLPEQYRQALAAAHGDGGQANGMSGVRPGVGPARAANRAAQRAYAARMKFGG